MSSDPFTDVLGPGRGLGSLAPARRFREIQFEAARRAFGRNGKDVLEFLRYVAQALDILHVARLARALHPMSDHEAIALDTLNSLMEWGGDFPEEQQAALNHTHARAWDSLLQRAHAEAPVPTPSEKELGLAYRYIRTVARALHARYVLTPQDFDTIVADWRHIVGPLPGDDE